MANPAKDRPPAVRFNGPFLGLNTTLLPRQLDSRFAVEAKNVILSQGRIRPRVPLEVIGSLGQPNGIQFNAEFISAVHWNPPLGDRPIIVAKGVGVDDSVVSYWKFVQDDTGPDTPIQKAVQLSVPFPLGLSRGPVCWVPVGNWMYIVDGSGLPLKFDGVGNALTPVGLLPPTVNSEQTLIGDPTLARPHVSFFRKVGLPEPNLTGAPEYAVTLYDSVNDVESNGNFIGPIQGEFQGFGFKVEFFANWVNIKADWARGLATQVRIYRKGNVDTLDPVSGETVRWASYRLVAVIDDDETSVTDPSYRDRSTPLEADQDAVPLLAEDFHSSFATGPWAPTKNWVPPVATVAVYYKDRMFYGGLTKGWWHAESATHNPGPPVEGLSEPHDLSSRIYYSEFGHPDHVDLAADFERLTGDRDDGVGGMVELAGQLLMGKRNSLWILAGTITTSTNETNATGAVPLASSHQLYRTKAIVGCANQNPRFTARTGGNSLIVAGDPPMAFFNSESGFYKFDGLAEQQVSKAIQPTWFDFVRYGDFTERAQRVTYAVDPFNECIYLCNGSSTETGRPKILVYHYNTGAWSELDASEQVVANHKEPSCVFSALGSLGPGGSVKNYSSLMVGVRGNVLSSNRYTLSMVIPTWCYETAPLRVYEGRRSHFYEVRFMHGRVSDDNVPDPLIRMGWRVDPRAPFEMVQRSAKDDIYHRQPIGQQGPDIALRMEDQGQSVLWSEQYGFTGWEIDAEVAGY